ncbi:unnamed protein product [Parnassius apollo]|uniref:(apollo) hypothetical protein n=1 Tax=Parnassius apollo TaxID=110799 RepID=A0A8S3YAL3_PARAO|nr:unnamed protein product [Parnassius apollo]
MCLRQVLFTACGDPRGCASCVEPVARLPLPRTCRYHAAPPPYAVFTLKKDESDSNSESNSSSDVSQSEDDQYLEDKTEVAVDNLSVDPLQYE